MVEWINVNNPKISRIAYNSEIKIMYIDFTGSIVDIPYTGVSEELFLEMSKANNVDQYYDSHIKGVYEKVELDTENKINLKL